MSNGRLFSIGASVGFVLMGLASTAFGSPESGASAYLMAMVFAGCITVALQGD